MYNIRLFIAAFLLIFSKSETVNFLGKTSLSRKVIENSLFVKGKFIGKDLTIYGSLDVRGKSVCENIIVQEILSINGSCEITRVSAYVGKISGYATILNSKFKSLTVSGNCTLSHVFVEHDITVSGKINAVSLDAGSLCIASDDIVLQDVHIKKNILFKKTETQSISSWLYYLFFKLFFDCDEQADPIRVYLKGASCINGDITFEGKNGIIYCDSTVNIKGKINGGKIVKY